MTGARPHRSKRSLQRGSSLKDMAYDEIKTRLVNCELEPGLLYSAQHFAEMLGVSRTPVREALLRLTNEGFLVCREVKGFKVREFSAKEMRDVVETRQVIESYVVRRLAGRLTPEDFQHLQHCQQQMTDCAARNDAAAFMRADRDFHMYLAHRSGNAHLASIMDNIRDHIALFGLQALMHERLYHEVIQEHAAILDTLLRQDRKQAVTAMRHHLRLTRERVLGPRQAAP